MFQSWDGIPMSKFSIGFRAVEPRRKPYGVSYVIAHGSATEASPRATTKPAHWGAQSQSGNRVWLQMGSRSARGGVERNVVRWGRALYPTFMHERGIGHRSLPHAERCDGGTAGHQGSTLPLHGQRTTAERRTTARGPPIEKPRWNGCWCRRGPPTSSHGGASRGTLPRHLGVRNTPREGLDSLGHGVETNEAAGKDS
eukprot:scaffold391_cov412-Pavlova_lutheri.AAC.2